MTKVEASVLKFLDRHKFALGFVIVSALALIARVAMVEFQSGDYLCCVGPWFDSLREGGGFAALGSYVGDYNAPYVTLLAALTYLPLPTIVITKGLSIVCDFFLAFSAVALVRTLVKDERKKSFFGLLIYAAVLFLPTVILNSAAWGQCDALYTGFIFLSLRALVREKYPAAFILFGAAFAFKLQAIFFLPVFVILYFSQATPPPLQVLFSQLSLDSDR